MTKRKARWAMWSLGKIAKRVIKEMKIADSYDIVAICSSDKQKAECFIKDNNLKEATAYTNINEILKRNDIDIVYIASPPWMHKEQACQVMNAGKACLIEKPMTQNAQDAIEIFDCAKKNHVLCAEGVWTNYFPAMQKAKEWIKAGKIGDVVEIISTFGVPINTFGVDVTDSSHWGNNLSQGGGALGQFGCYNVNLAQFVFNKLPDDIQGITQRIARKDGADLNTAVMLSYADGKQHALLSCSWTARTMSVSRISGTTGEIIIGNPFFCPYHVELLTHQNHLWYNDPYERFDDEYEKQGYEGFKYQFDAISKYILSGKTESDEVSFKYSIELATTMERIRKALDMI